jgi:hypothetical protein
MNCSIQSLIEQSEQRDHNFAELCKAIDELDVPTLERTLAYAARRREAFMRGDPRIKLVVDEPSSDATLSSDIARAATALDIVHEAAARVEKPVKTRRNAKTRKGNAKTRKIYTKNAATKKLFSAGAIKVAWALPTTALGSSTAKDIAFATKLRLGAVYVHLKALDAHSNRKGGWWIDKNKKDYLANFKGKKKANGAATSP